MPATYINIATTTLSSNQATVTFSSIAATYTDLVLRMSVRTNRNDVGIVTDGVKFTLNSAATGYSNRWIQGTGSVVSTTSNTSQTFSVAFGGNSDQATASTFASLELYIPSYTAARDKPIHSFGMSENNNTNANMFSVAHLFRNSATISSIELSPQIGTNFLSGSTFYLYGIKNS